jgi:hypothetical protein
VALLLSHASIYELLQSIRGPKMFKIYLKSFNGFENSNLLFRSLTGKS